MVICGDCGQRKLSQEIIDTCCNSGGAVVFDGEKLFQSGDDPFFLVLCLNSLSDLNIRNCLIVLGKALIGMKNDIDLSGYVCILDGENRDSIDFACSSGMTSVGCSMNGHDTLTVSAFGEDGKAVVALRRCISFSGREIEPCEFSVPMKQTDNIYPFLAGCAVTLLSGTAGD